MGGLESLWGLGFRVTAEVDTKTPTAPSVTFKVLASAMALKSRGSSWRRH